MHKLTGESLIMRFPLPSACSVAKTWFLQLLEYQLAAEAFTIYGKTKPEKKEPVYVYSSGLNVNTQNTGFVIDHRVSLGSKHVDDVCVSTKSKVGFHILQMKPCGEPASQIPVHGLCNVELKWRSSSVRCKRPDIPPAGLLQLSERMCKLSVRVILREKKSCIMCNILWGVFYNRVHHLSVLRADMLWNPVIFVQIKDFFFCLFFYRFASKKMNLI